jgi:hypothetical protein
MAFREFSPFHTFNIALRVDKKLRFPIITLFHSEEHEKTRPPSRSGEKDGVIVFRRR